MKKIILLATMLVASCGAFADTTTQTVSPNAALVAQGQNTSAASESKSQANNEGVIGAIYNTPADTTSKIDQTIKQEFGTQVIKNTPSVSGPALTSSNDTCMGSTSGSANVPGIGIGFGTSWVDTNCKMLKNGRELWNMGMKAAAMALMCTDGANREALELTGFECPQTARDRKNTTTATSASTSNEPTDPIVRARMGLPAIK